MEPDLVPGRFLPLLTSRLWPLEGNRPAAFR